MKLIEVPELPESLYGDKAAMEMFTTVCQALIDEGRLTVGRSRVVELFAHEYGIWFRLQDGVSVENIERIKEVRLTNAALNRKLNELGFGKAEEKSTGKPSTGRAKSAGTKTQSKPRILKHPNAKGRTGQRDRR